MKQTRINKVILHCTATKEGQDFKAKDIDNWHKAKGWKGIGYHFVIDIDGTVEAGRNEDEQGAHCSGHNNNSLGIVYVGGLDSHGEAKDTRTPAQKSALLDLVFLLLEKYHLSIDDVYCHNQLSSKQCPCFSIRTFREEFEEAF